MKHFITLIFVWSAYFTLNAQIQLTVYDQNQMVIPHVKVIYTINQTDYIQITDFEGHFHLKQNDINCQESYEFTFIALSYDTLKQQVNCHTQSVQLKPSENWLDEVCVTGQYVQTTTQQSVNKMTVITEEQIEKSGATNLTEILSYQTNIRIEQDNVLGSSIEMGGMSGENVKVLIDGVPVIGRLDGNIDLNQINLENVERIEVVNGPLSVNYGTNALAGTINIITKKGVKDGLNGQVNAYYESFGSYNLTGNLAYKHKQHLLKMSGGRKYFDGWDAKDPFIQWPKETLADTNRYLQWNPKLQYMGDVQYIYTYKSWKVNPFSRAYHEKIMNRGFPSTPYYETAFDDYYYTLRFDNGINLNKQFDNSNFEAILSYNYYQRIKNTYLVDLTTLNQALTSESTDHDTSRFDLAMARLTYSSSKIKWMNYQLGLDFNYESAYGRKIEDHYKTIGDYAAYATFKFKTLKEKLIINPGVRYAYNTNYNAPVIPSLNLKYAHKKVTFRASAAKGFRAPTLKELYFNFVDVNHNIQGNTDLKAEDSWNFLASANWMKAVSAKGILKTGVSGFMNYFNNRITLGVTDDNSYTYLNIGEYSTVGVQVEAALRLQQMSVNVNLAYIGRENLTEGTNLERYLYSPEASVQFMYKFKDSRWGANVFYKYNGMIQQYYIGDDDLVSVSQTSPYSILDMSLNRSFLDKKLSVVFGVKNLLDVQNVNVTGVSSTGVHSSSGNMSVGRGTSAFIQVKYTFNTLKPKENASK